VGLVLRLRRTVSSWMGWCIECTRMSPQYAAFGPVGRRRSVLTPVSLKNLRQFFLAMVRSHAAATFLVYENERYTFKETFDHASRAASVFRDVYGIHKGDRVAIVMRNYPQVRLVLSSGRAAVRAVSTQRNSSLTCDSIRITGYFIAKCSARIPQQWIFCYWACHLLGAVPVLVNAFVPAHVVSHCITLTTCKLIVLDAERSVLLTPNIAKICTDSGATGVLVVVKKDADEKRGFLKSAFKEGKSWDDVMNDPKHTKIVASQSWKKEPECNFSDDGSIFFTSGTSVPFMPNRKSVRLRPSVQYWIPQRRFNKSASFNRLRISGPGGPNPQNFTKRRDVLFQRSTSVTTSFPSKHSPLPRYGWSDHSPRGHHDRRKDGNDAQVER
jgi:hypothetical protein